MKLHPALVILLASLCQAAQATTLTGASILEPVTYVVEDLNPNDGIEAQAKVQTWYAPEVELNVYGATGYGSANKVLTGNDRFARAGMAPSSNFNYGVYGGGELGSMNLFSNFSNGAVNYGKLFNALHFQVTPHTRIRFKSKVVLQGMTQAQGPALPEVAQLTLNANLITYLNGMPYQNKLFNQVLTQEVGKLYFSEPVEMEVSNESDYPTTISIYYHTTNHGVYGE